LNNNKKNIYTKKTITKQVKNTSKATKPESIVSTVEEKRFHGSQLTNTDVSPKNKRGNKNSNDTGTKKNLSIIINTKNNITGDNKPIKIETTKGRESKVIVNQQSVIIPSSNIKTTNTKERIFKSQTKIERSPEKSSPLKNRISIFDSVVSPSKSQRRE